MKQKQGYFLIEALLSIVIFSVLTLSLFSMISFLQRRTTRSTFESEASLLMQEGVEIGHTAILADWEGYPDNTYFPAFDASSQTWVLFPGEETNVQARYSRSIVLRKVCRDTGDGERLEVNQPCAGEIDQNSREIIVKIGWQERGELKEMSTELLVFHAQ